MATTVRSPPPPSPPNEVENDRRQPPISPSPPPAAPPPPSPPIEEVEHHQQPENPTDCERPPPEDVEDHYEPPIPPSPPPHEEFHDRRKPLAPTSPSLYSTPPTGPEHSPENLTPEHVSELRESLNEPEDRFDNPNFTPNQQPQSSSFSPTGPINPVENPNYSNYPNPNSNPDHESPSPSSPPPESSFPSPSATTLQENPSPKSLSPPPTATSPSSPQGTLDPSTGETPPPEPPLGLPLLLHATAISSQYKPQPSSWTHQETANLIQAYQEKWYSLKKGPLKASQWEEVAITVAARCGYDEPTKSAKQCRHKIEKLRKRYRAEKAKPRSKATAWNFFKLMENLEKGPLPISSSRPLAMIEYPKSSNSNSKKRKNEDSDGEFHVTKDSSRSKSFNHHVVNVGLTRNLQFSDGVMRGLRTPVLQKHKGFYHEDDKDEEEEEEEDDYDEEEGDVAAQLAAEIKGFAEKFVKMENKKIEMIRDTERYRMEMENKRMEMILESQQMILDSVNKAFSSSLKAQKLSAT